MLLAEGRLDKISIKSIPVGGLQLRLGGLGRAESRGGLRSVQDPRVDLIGQGQRMKRGGGKGGRRRRRNGAGEGGGGRLAVWVRANGVGALRGGGEVVQVMVTMLSTILWGSVYALSFLPKDAPTLGRIRLFRE